MNLILLVIAGLILPLQSQAPQNYLQNNVPVYEWVNEQTYNTTFTISDLQLPKEILENIDREIDFIIISPRIIEKEMCSTHNTVHKSFDEVDNSCVDIQYYERDYSSLNSVTLQFLDGTGYYWER